MTQSCPSSYSCFFLLQLHKNLTQTELNAMIDRYVVENMLLLSTADSDSFRALTGKIPDRAGAGPPCKKTFYMDAK